MADGDGYGLVHAFMNQSRDFVLGWEACDVWTRLNGLHDQHDTYGMLARRANKAELMRIADALGFTSQWKDIDGTWADVTFQRRTGEADHGPS